MHTLNPVEALGNARRQFHTLRIMLFVVKLQSDLADVDFSIPVVDQLNFVILAKLDPWSDVNLEMLSGYLMFNKEPVDDHSLNAFPSIGIDIYNNIEWRKIRWDLYHPSKHLCGALTREVDSASISKRIRTGGPFAGQVQDLHGLGPDP